MENGYGYKESRFGKIKKKLDAVLERSEGIAALGAIPVALYYEPENSMELMKYYVISAAAMEVGLKGVQFIIESYRYSKEAVRRPFSQAYKKVKFTTMNYIGKVIGRWPGEFSIEEYRDIIDELYDTVEECTDRILPEWMYRNGLFSGMRKNIKSRFKFFLTRKTFRST